MLLLSSVKQLLVCSNMNESKISCGSSGVAFWHSNFLEYCVKIALTKLPVCLCRMLFHIAGKVWIYHHLPWISLVELFCLDRIFLWHLLVCGITKSNTVIGFRGSNMLRQRVIDWRLELCVKHKLSATDPRFSHSWQSRHPLCSEKTSGSFFAMVSHREIDQPIQSLFFLSKN